MNKILSINDAINKSAILQKAGKTIVLAGGCFDVLHIGHIEFLKNAKNTGDILMVLLESDENIKKLKGENRPINTQEDRAAILENLEMVDYVIKLPPIETDHNYDNLVISLKPAIIAITKGDPARSHKERQADLTGSRVVEVSDQITNRSTTRLIDILKEI